MTQEKSDYYNLQNELYRMYNRRRNIRIFLLVSIFCGVLSIIYGIQNSLPIINVAIATLFIVFIVFFILALANLVWVNMNQSDVEEKMVKNGVEYLHKNRLSQKRIEIIEKRAEIGNGAFSSRTILPLSAIPFLITFFSGKISSETQLFIAIVIMLIGASFLLELDRANMDILIRQICVSYTPKKREKKAREK